MPVEYDLNDLSERQLLTLKSRVEKALTKFEERRKSDAIAALKKEAKKHGYSLDDLVSTSKSSKKQKSSLPPKYRNPANPDQTWTGHGRRPKWFLELVEDGHDEQDLLIAA